MNAANSTSAHTLQHSGRSIRARLNVPRNLSLSAGMWLGDHALRLVGPRYDAFMWVITHSRPSMLERLGRMRAERAAIEAKRRVPAYQEHLLQPGTTETVRVGSRVMPTTDKVNYVQRYPVADRCRDGILPTSGVTIDESSGSSGTPFNWIRLQTERRATHLFISHFARYCFGKEPFITINAFSMGAWATGVNMAVALERNSVVKSTGPDVDKIFRTLERFGTQQPYLICGYPPFLKHLIDYAETTGFPLNEYQLMGLVGGEGMSEGLRDYLMPTFQPVYSGYGATDIEIGLAGETPLSVAIRRLARDDERVRQAMFGSDPRLPMLFQYNPLQHHINVSDSGELIFTINRLDVLAPRIAYNIHDEGGVLRFDAAMDKLAALGIDANQLIDGKRPVQFPFVWIYGRKDSTVSVMGANLYPEDVEQALYSAPELAKLTNSFCISLVEEIDGGVRPCFAFEIVSPITPDLQAAFETQIIAGVEALNADFREALVEHAAAATPQIQLHPRGTGPFAGDAGRIKQVRLARS